MNFQKTYLNSHKNGSVCCYSFKLHYLVSIILVTFLCVQATASTVPNLSYIQNSQNQSVEGTVIDENNQPLPGVYVKLKNTNVTAITDIKGKFKITIPNNSTNNTLIFTFIGYITKEINIGAKTSINVTLLPDVKSLNEVVVIGYGSVAKKDLTGSVGTVKVEDLQRAPVISFDQALAGRIAGVQISSNDGQPGSEGVNIVIRGANSLTQDNSPLYVVDGFPLEGLEASSINPQDIESITVLKDASSTAIYGARGANGVIVIETKKGKVGAPTINYSSSLGINEITRQIPMMNAYEFVSYNIDRNPTVGRRNYARADLDPTDASYDANGRTLEDYRNIEGTNWQDELFRTGNTQIHNLSLRGGNKETRYAVSGSIFDQGGVIINSAAQRYQGRVSLDQTITNKLSAGVNINYSSNVSSGQNASAGSTSGSATSYLLYATFGFRPVTGNDINLEDELVDEEVDLSNDYRINPILSAKNEYRKSISNNTTSNLYVNYKFNKYLVLRLQGGLNSRSLKREEFYNTLTSRGTPLIPSNIRGVQGAVNFAETNTWSNENTLTYNQTFNKIHTLNIVGGSSLQSIKTNQFGQFSQLIPNEALGISGIDEGVPLPNAAELSESKLASFFGRINYNYRSRYYLTATYRADASSRFSPDNRWSYFPSAALSWRLKEEPFLKKVNFISDAKIRLSYGSTGNNRVDDFAYLPILSSPIAASYSFNNGTPSLGITPTSLSNKKLEWETTNSLDIGYDLALFNSRVELTLDWYRKRTKNLLLRANIPFTSGYENAFRNIGEVQNQGFEISLSTHNIVTDNFKWNTDFNISFNENKIIALNRSEEFMLSNITWNGPYNNSYLYLAKIGGPAAQFFGYIFDGVYQLSDFEEVTPGNIKLKPNIPDNGTPRENIKPGDIRYKDLNNDLFVNSSDQTILGRTLPKHIGGINNNFSYKGLNLNVFLQWSYGNQIYNANRIFFEGGARGSNLNQFATYNNRWTPTNPSNEYPSANGPGPNGIYSSRVLEDGSFLRLKTVALDYTIPRKFSDKLKLKSVNLSVSAQNLYTWTNYSGLDPEVSVRNSALTPGFDFSAYPRARTIVFGLNVNL